MYVSALWWDLTLLSISEEMVQHSRVYGCMVISFKVHLSNKAHF